MLQRLLINNKKRLRSLLERLQLASVRGAAREQKLGYLSERLRVIVPELLNQYSTFQIDTELKELSTRVLHAFQINLVLKAIELIFNNQSAFMIVDIGDSSGTHLTYLKNLLKDSPQYGSCEFKYLSVNLDQVAIEKIRQKGIDAILCRAEDLYEKHKISANLLLSFEMLEHLYDPICFLDNISKKSECDLFVLTVPYLAQSRVGLHHLRKQQNRKVFPENTHIFELSPGDWKLIFQHSGWMVVEEQIYRQYPLWSPWVLMKPIWKRLDFEGFYGVILRIDRTWAANYQC